MAWEDIDERCPYCDNVTKQVRGFNKQNLKKLLFSKPTVQDLIMLFVIIMVLFGAWRYDVEMGMCREIVENPQEVCVIWYNNMAIKNASQQQNNDLLKINLSELLVTNEK